MIDRVSTGHAWPVRAFLVTALVNAVWINASEVFRYFVFVMPMMRAAFPEVQGVAPMDLGVFAVWGLWDTILVLAVTGAVWVALDHFGSGVGNALMAGFCVWLAIFGILWLGLYNMNLATPAVLAVALPLSLLEMLVAALIVRWGRGRFSASPTPV